MSDPVTIKHLDSLGGSQVLITLSDGRVLAVTLEQILSVGPQVLPEDEQNEDLG